MAQIFDISVPLKVGMVHWPTDPPFEAEPFKTIEDGDGSSVTRISMGTHSGTHVDPPRHFIPGGRSIDRIDPAALIGECLVVEDLAVEVIDAAAVRRLLASEEPKRVLFKTRSSALWSSDEFREDYVSLDATAAREIVARGVNVVGVDYLSVGERSDGGPVHTILLEAGIVVVEGLNLSGVMPGRYEFICLPLRIKGGDGAPARAVLRSP